MIFKNVKSGEDGTVVYDAAGNGYNGTVINADVKEEDGKNWLDLNGDGSLTTGLRSVDYPYTVQFDLKVDKKETHSCLMDETVVCRSDQTEN